MSQKWFGAAFAFVGSCIRQFSSVMVFCRRMAVFAVFVSRICLEKYVLTFLPNLKKLYQGWNMQVFGRDGWIGHLAPFSGTIRGVSTFLVTFTRSCIWSSVCVSIGLGIVPVVRDMYF
jgi:hypothetical protein